MKSRPTLKHKKRYILFRVMETEREGKEGIKRAFFGSLLSLLGEIDASDAQARLLLYSAGRGILSCTPEYVDRCIVALACMKKINKAEAFVDIIGVFGTVKDAKEVMQDG